MGSRFGVAPMKRLDEETRKRNAALNAKAMRRSNRVIADEYSRLGQAPVQAGDMLVSPELAAMLDPHRSEAE